MNVLCELPRPRLVFLPCPSLGRCAQSQRAKPACRQRLRRPRCSAPAIGRPKGRDIEQVRPRPNELFSPSGYTTLKARLLEQTLNHFVVLVRFGAKCAVRLRTMPWVSPPAFTGRFIVSQTERLKAKHPQVFLLQDPKAIGPNRVDQLQRLNWRD